MPFPRTCERCKKDFEVKHHSKKGRFCSKICMDEWQRSATIEERYGNEVAKRIRKDRSIMMLKNNPNSNPEVLKKKSESLKKFFQENPNHQRGENNSFFGKKHTKEFCRDRSKERKGKRFWNKEQFEKLLKNTPRGKNHPLWKHGASITKYTGFTKVFKKMIRDRDGNICVECGDIGSGRKLPVHHIDYDKNNTTPQNTITLCPKCHGKTNHLDREMWTKYFREKYKIQLEKILL